MNQERREITEGWLHKAESDLAYAKLDPTNLIT